LISKIVPLFVFCILGTWLVVIEALKFIARMNVLKMGEFGSLTNVTNFPKQCSLYCPHWDFVYLSLPFWAKVFFLDLCLMDIYIVWYNLSQIVCEFMQVKIVFDHFRIWNRSLIIGPWLMTLPKWNFGKTHSPSLHQMAFLPCLLSPLVF
jgi:hypothetical protein